MLQPRLSPSLFQQHQYGSPSTRKNSLSNPRRSIATSPSSPALAPPTRPVHYVSRGTQYSPPTQIMEDTPVVPLADGSDQEPPSQDALRQNLAAPTPIPEPPPSPTLKPESIPKQESPSLKRRQKQEEASISTVRNSQALAAKRVRPENAPVKVLPVRYELCEVEDIVILIANMISELIETNDDLPLRQGVLTRFHSR